MSSSTDCRGVPRGKCSVCGCDQYDGGSEGKRCIMMNCDHPPGKHLNTNTGFASLAQLTVSPSLSPTSMDVNTDGVSSSLSQPSFDLNTGLDYDDDDELPQAMKRKDDSVSFIQSSKSSVSLFASPLKQSSTHQNIVQSLFKVATSASAPPRPFISPAPQHQQQQQEVPVDQQCILSGCTRKKYTDPQTGFVHDFCGIKHARKHEEQNCQVPPDLQCKTPGCFRQRYMNEQGAYFDYCGKFCRDNGGKPLEPMHASASAPNIALTSDGQCVFPGCKKTKYRDPANNRTHDFCGRTHAYQAKIQGITANAVNIRVATRQEQSGITATFQQKWAKGKGSCPPVSSVYIITNTQLTQRWQAYKSGLQNPVVEQYYHGTKLACNITVNSALCNDKECGVCGISNTGLDRRCIRKNIQFQRFGHGFYLAPNSSKCHDYTQGSHSFRAMLVFDVCPGYKYALKSDNEKLKGPPQGFDSVHGQTGVRLKYEELVVYNPDAALPRYIIVYQLDGEKKIAK